MKTGYWVAFGVLGFVVGAALIGLNKGSVGATGSTGGRGPLSRAPASVQIASTDSEPEKTFQKGQVAAKNKDYNPPQVGFGVARDRGEESAKPAATGFRPSQQIESHELSSLVHQLEGAMVGQPTQPSRRDYADRVRAIMKLAGPAPRVSDFLSSGGSFEGDYAPSRFGARSPRTPDNTGAELNAYNQARNAHNAILTLYQRCWASIFAKKFSNALSAANELVLLARNDADRCGGFLCRGSVNNLIRDSDAAIRDFSEALRLGHRGQCDAVAYDGRGESYRMKGEYGKAIADCSSAIRLDGRWAPPYKNRGKAYMGKRMFDRARDDFSVAIGLNPDADDSYEGRAWCHLVLGDLRSAFKDAQSALSINANSAAAHIILASCYQRSGDRGRAKSHEQAGKGDIVHFGWLRDLMYDVPFSGLTMEQVRRAMNAWLEAAERLTRAERLQRELAKQQYFQRRNAQARRSHTKTRQARLKSLGIDADRIKSCIPRPSTT